MQFSWKTAGLVALGSGVIYAVYRAEHEANAPAATTAAFHAMMVSPNAPTPPALKKPLLGDMAPAAGTGTAMFVGFVTYAAYDTVWRAIKAGISGTVKS